MTSNPVNSGYWRSNGTPPSFTNEDIKEAIFRINQLAILVRRDGQYGIGRGGIIEMDQQLADSTLFPIAAYVPPCPLHGLGDASFCHDHGLKYPYVAGGMANGIGSVEIVQAMGRAGMLGFFGAAGLAPADVERAIDRIQSAADPFPYGFNLIHSPNEPELEERIVDLYITRGVYLTEASAYLNLTPSVVRYRVHGIHEDAAGRIVTPNRLIAKVSRIEVASKFLSPPPEKLLNDLVTAGKVTRNEAMLAAKIPMAQDITVEADSGGHTDNRPAVTLVPTMLALRDRLQSQFRYENPVRIGGGGGVSTPASAAAFFSMGASYVVTGTVNQCTLEAGTSDSVREMLSQAGQADVTMAPAADMFEMGVKLQVLKRGTMFAMRAAKLYDIYRAYDSLDALPSDIRLNLEKSIFRDSLESIWTQTKAFFESRDPGQNDRAARDARHRMALIFRWYLGQSSRWANIGEPTRKIDYQIWCGPAMGAFNEWVKGSFLEDFRGRDIVTIAMNILFGAAVNLRLQALAGQGVKPALEWSRLEPLEVDQIMEFLS